MISKVKFFSLKYLFYENRIQLKIMVIKKDEAKEEIFNTFNRKENTTFNRVKLQALCIMKLYNV